MPGWMRKHLAENEGVIRGSCGPPVERETPAGAGSDDPEAIGVALTRVFGGADGI